MGIRLFVEVLDHAPDALTWRERYALAVLAENANDVTRECWPGIEDDPAIAHRMRLPGRSSRYDVLAALRKKGALKTVTAGHRGRRAVYLIPELGPETPDAFAPEKGPGTTDTGSGNHGPNPEPKGPQNPDPSEEKGSGNEGERVREPREKGPETQDPYSSHPSTPQEEEASTVPPIDMKLFGEFWLAYPKSRNKDATITAWRAALDNGADPRQIINAALAYAREKQGEDFRYVKYSVNWLRERRYEDDYAPEPASRPRLRAVAGGWQPYKQPDPDAYTRDLGF
ncbi:hypothetical protein [Streptomyces ardesiacus]|uniref:hypothetical protein n=1 Tax=Streptomyces ardesiacus TaxID=285564 RepID=UPI002FDC3BD5